MAKISKVTAGCMRAERPHKPHIGKSYYGKWCIWYSGFTRSGADVLAQEFAAQLNERERVNDDISR